MKDYAIIKENGEYKIIESEKITEYTVVVCTSVVKSSLENRLLTLK